MEQQVLSPVVQAGIVYLVNKMKVPMYRIVAHEGGTRSGKTYNTIQYLVDLALEQDNREITIASRDMPHLKKGAIKDFLKIMKKRRIYRDSQWHESDKKYTFHNGSYIEFFNADDIGKVSGPGRHYLYCNEVNFFKKSVFDQLLMRTEIACIVDYNPIHPKHWVYDILERKDENGKKDAFLWRSTYKDNLKFLPPALVREIELMRVTDPLRWHVYGEGKRGFFQKGQIYGEKRGPKGEILQNAWNEITLTDYNQIVAQEYFALDWGFYPDPNACLAVKFVDNKRYIRKVLYEKSLSNAEIAQRLFAAGLDDKSIIIADSSDPKSIVELRTLGFPLVYQAIKGKNSIDYGIKLLQTKDIYYVADPDLEFEYYNYTYLLGPDEEPTGVPLDKYNHLMDDLRYMELYKPYL